MFDHVNEEFGSWDCGKNYATLYTLKRHQRKIHASNTVDLKEKKQSKGCDRKSQQRQTSTEIVTATKDLTFQSWRPVLREVGHLAPRDLT